MEVDQVQDEVQDTPETTEEVKTPDVETLVAAEVERVSQQYKKELAGLNRRNSELEKIAEDQKKAAMDEQERILYELEQERAALTNAKADFSRSQNKEKALKFAVENKIPTNLLDTMSFDSWETVEANLSIIKSVVDSERKRAIEEFKTGSGHAPPAGSVQTAGKLSLEALSGLSPSEMTKALSEGRIPGFGRS